MVSTPYAVEVMAEDGIDISQQKSKLIDLDYFNAADLIVTLCGDAKDRCPIIPPSSPKPSLALTRSSAV